MKLTHLHEGRFDDEDEDRNLSKSDAWLKRYTLENMDKWPSDGVRKELLDDYPYDGGTIYRGLNFHDEAQYNKFMEETKDGTMLETGSISSWTRDAGTAKQFSLTRPTYFIDRELMQAEDAKQKNRDFMIGHAGVILKATVGKHVGIDVNKSKHGKENEVILIPGKYRIGIEKNFVPFMRSITKDNYKQEFMAIKDIRDQASGDSQGRKFEHIMFHYKDMDDNMKDHLWNLIKHELKDVKWQVSRDEVLDWDSVSPKNRNAKKNELYVGWNLSSEFFLYYELLQPEAQAKVDSIVKSLIKKIDKDFVEKIKDLNWEEDKIDARVAPTLQFAINQGHVHPEFVEHLKRGSAIRYHSLNSLEKIRAINKLDPKDQRDAIHKMTKDILSTLQNLANATGR